MNQEWDDFTTIVNECNKLKGISVFILSKMGNFVTVSVNDKEFTGDFSSEFFLNKIMDNAVNSVKIDYSIPNEYNSFNIENNITDFDNSYRKII